MGLKKFRDMQEEIRRCDIPEALKTSEAWYTPKNAALTTFLVMHEFVKGGGMVIIDIDAMVAMQVSNNGNPHYWEAVGAGVLDTIFLGKYIGSWK